MVEGTTTEVGFAYGTNSFLLAKLLSSHSYSGRIMQRREVLFVASGALAIAGCIDDEADRQPESGTESGEEPEEEESEETEEPAPAEFEVIDLSVEPSQIAPGESVTVTATVENKGGTEGTEDLQFEIDGETVDGETVGDTTFEEITEGETVTEQVTVPPEESSTVSISVTRELVGTFGVSVADLSVNFEVVRDWNEIGDSYEGAGGLTVTLESFELNEKTGSYEYAIEYTLENETDSSIDEGAFQLYPTDPNNDPLQQFGGFDELFPDDSVSRNYTFEEEKDIEFSTLAYHPDQFFSQSPPSDALVWPVDY